MSNVGKKALLSCSLNSKTCNAPIEWRDTNVLATFDNENIQANITIDKFTFVNSEYDRIKTEWLDNGRHFEGMPFNFTIKNKNNTNSIFDGYLDLTDDAVIDEIKRRIQVKFKNPSELSNLDDKLGALTFGLLESKNFFTSKSYVDLEYVVEKENNFLEVLISAIILYVMIKELKEAVYRVAHAVANAVAHVTGGVTGSIAAAVYSVVVAVLEIAYTAAILVAVIEMARKLFTNLVPPKRNAKAITLYKALNTICVYLGYTFSSNITELNECVYLPSNFNFDESDIKGVFSKVHGTTKGIPNSSDIGYNCREFFNIMSKLFNAKFAVVDNSIYFLNENDPYWFNKSTWKMPNIQKQPYRFNTSEMISNKKYVFETDITDEFTIKDYQGTCYAVHSDLTSYDSEESKFIKGYEELRFGVSIGSTKQGFNGLENFLLEVSKDIDSFCGTSYASRIKSKIGILKISNNNYNNPKILRLNGLKPYDRANWSAKYIYEKFYATKSFTGLSLGQKKLYDNIKIPMGLDEYNLLIKNSTFITDDAKEGKITKLTYSFDYDYAIMSYWIREIYTTSIIETYIEPKND